MYLLYPNTQNQNEPAQSEDENKSSFLIPLSHIFSAM